MPATDRASTEPARSPPAAFLNGLTRPSLGALLVTLAVPLFALVLCMVLITPELLASEAHRYFARDGTDGDLFLTAKLAAITGTTPQRPVVVVLGGSAIVESVTNVRMLRRLLTESVGVPVGVWGLASWGQSLGASLAIVEHLPRRFDGVVIVGVTPFSMALGPDVRPGMLGEEWAFDDGGSIGVAVDSAPGNYFWSNRDFFLPRLTYLVRNLREGPVLPSVHPFTARKAPLPERIFAELAPKLVQRVETAYPDNFEACLETLAQLIHEAHERGQVEVVILESPISPRAVRDVLGESFWREHRDRLAAFAARNGAHYWYLQPEADIGGEDFYDFNHLYRRPAMRRHTEVMARRAAELLTAEGADS